MTEGAATSWLAALSRRLHQARPFDREEAIASADRNGWACFKGLSKGADLRDLVIIDRSTTFLSGVDAADLDLAA
jgi:hypothetical protein